MPGFPNGTDSFEPVVNGETIVASDINPIATAATQIQKVAKNLILTEKPAECVVVGGVPTVRRRRLFLNCVKVDSGTGVDYIDTQVTIKDDLGAPIAGAWTSKDHAIALEVANTYAMPNYPTNTNQGTVYTSSNICGKPYNYAITGYADNGATAKLRLYNDSPSTNLKPYMVKVHPKNNWLYVLGGADLTSLKIHRWQYTDITKAYGYAGSFTITAPAGYTGTLLDNIRDFTVTDNYIYVLFRRRNTNERGVIVRYRHDGTVSMADWPSTSIGYFPNKTSARDMTNKMVMTSLTSDTKNRVYIAGYISVSVSDTHISDTPTDAKSGRILQTDEDGYMIHTATSKWVTVGEDKNLLSSNYTHRYGDNFRWSWPFSISYSPSDGYIYAAWNSAHWASFGLNPHTFIVRYTPDTLQQALADYQHINADKLNHQYFHVAAYKSSGGSNYVLVGHPYTDLGANDAADPRITLMEVVSGAATHQIYRYRYDVPTVSGETYITSAGFNINTDTNGVLLGSSNVLTGIAISKGLVFYCTSGCQNKVHCATVDTNTTSPGLQIPLNPIKAMIRVTSVTAADPASDLKYPDTGNFAINPGFTAGASTVGRTYIPAVIKNDRNAVLLRDKPSPSISGVGASGWGFMKVDDIDTWHDNNAADLLSDVVTDPYSQPDTSSGITKVLTGAAGMTGDVQLGFIKDPPHCLYIPATWIGNYKARGWTTAYEVIDAAMSSDYGTDVTPVYRTAAIEVKGDRGVPVLECNLPRAYQSGDLLHVTLKYQFHMLDTIQTLDYDHRGVRAYFFLQYLDASNVPLLPATPDHYPTDNKPVYRLDWWTGKIDTALTSGVYYVSSSLKPTTHVYQVSYPSWLTFEKKDLPVPSGTQRIRLGFVCACWSEDRDDNILTDPGESGGLYVDDIHLSLFNQSIA